MRRLGPAALAAALTLSGCGLLGRPKPPPAPGHYTLGAPFELGGVWYYPKDRNEYEATGLAAVAPDREGATSDGETFDQTALAGSHHTLQLPSVVRVTNLENGRQILLRLNDRGPDNPGRLAGLTRHAAELLGAADGTQIRVVLDSETTRALIEQVGGGPALAIEPAPREAVAAEALAPPPGVAQSNRRYGLAALPVAQGGETHAPHVPDRFPDEVLQGPPEPGRIMLRASEFGRADYANRVAAQLAGLDARVERVAEGRSSRFLVQAGPFASVASADAALDQARRAGVIDSRLVVE